MKIDFQRKKFFLWGVLFFPFRGGECRLRRRFFLPSRAGLFCRGGLRPGSFQMKKFFLWGVFIFPLRGGGESPPAKGFFAVGFVFSLPGGEWACGPAHFAFSEGRFRLPASHFFCLDKKSNQKKPLSEGPAGLIVGCFLAPSLLHQLLLPLRRRRILVSRNTSANTHYIALSCNSPPQKEASGILP